MVDGRAPASGASQSRNDPPGAGHVGSILLPEPVQHHLLLPRDPFEEERDHVRRYLSRDGKDIAWDLIRLAYASVADTAVATMQDLMTLGNEARMNYPSRPSGNWQWRYSSEMLTDEIAHRLAQITELYGRAPATDRGGE